MVLDISDTSYRIAIPLEVVQHDDETEAPRKYIEQKRIVLTESRYRLLICLATLLLTVTYPGTYPDIPPDLTLSAPPDAPKHTHLDIQDDRTRLLSALQPVIDENLGMAMIFTLVSTLKDSAELLISERQAAAQSLKDIVAARAEEEENRKFHGTAVTRETFLAWRDRFRKEMAEAEEKRREDKEAEDKKRRIKAEDRLTGKQLFEKGLVGKVEEDEEEEGGADLVRPVRELEVED